LRSRIDEGSGRRAIPAGAATDRRDADVDGICPRVRRDDRVPGPQQLLAEHIGEL